MFESRLNALLIGFGACLVVLALRLVQLQVVRADFYRQSAEQALFFKTTPLPFVRGSIKDRHGRVMVSDEPCWDVRIDYSVMVADIEVASAESLSKNRASQRPPSMKRQVKRLKRAKRYPDATSDDEIEQRFVIELDQMWRDLARLSSISAPLSVDELHDRAREHYERIARIRRTVEQRRGFESPVAEELETQIILRGLAAEDAIDAREALAQYPWLHVEPSVKRSFDGDFTPLAHILGRIGRVEAEEIEADPNPDDVFARYLPDEPIGTSGVEAAAERLLRGRRGEITRDRSGNVIADIAAEDGRDAVITIDTELQSRLYQLLGDAVRKTPDSSGGSIVVLEIPTREVLALVSYPSFDPRQFDRIYDSLRDDTEHLPLVCRAVANHYPPGSTVKPLVCLAGLINGRIGLDTRESCTGYLFEDQKDAWRCWEIHGTNTRMAHGSIDVVEALTGSCNIFMYRLGERLGIDQLCEAFRMFGIGEKAGTGLPEEAPGINPNREWFRTRDRELQRKTAITPGTLRNFAIGQGELTVTPLQAANIMATYAAGKFKPVTLVRSDQPAPEWDLPGTSAQWAAIRNGIYGVVNDSSGTAYKYAHFEHPNYVICGKTGSATTASWPTAYRLFVQFENGERSEVVVRARTRRDAIERAIAENPGASVDESSVEVASRWPLNPPSDDRYAHAWFAGYLQAVDANHQPNWSQAPRLAFAILIEFGGSGGRTSGPLAKQVATELLELYGPELTIDLP